MTDANLKDRIVKVMVDIGDTVGDFDDLRFQRCGRAGHFAGNGAGVRGDLKAVVRAILLDPEARDDTPAADSGRLKSEVSKFLNSVRAA